MRVRGSNFAVFACCVLFRISLAPGPSCHGVRSGGFAGSRRQVPIEHHSAMLKLSFLAGMWVCVCLSWIVRGKAGWRDTERVDGRLRWAKSPIATIASDFGSRTQIAALFAQFCCIGVFKPNIANRAVRIAVSNRKDTSDSNRAFLNR